MPLFTAELALCLVTLQRLFTVLDGLQEGDSVADLLRYGAEDVFQFSGPLVQFLECRLIPDNHKL